MGKSFQNFMILKLSSKHDLEDFVSQTKHIFAIFSRPSNLVSSDSKVHLNFFKIDCFWKTKRILGSEENTFLTYFSIFLICDVYCLVQGNVSRNKAEILSVKLPVYGGLKATNSLKNFFAWKTTFEDWRIIQFSGRRIGNSKPQNKKKIVNRSRKRNIFGGNKKVS